MQPKVVTPAAGQAFLSESYFIASAKRVLNQLLARKATHRYSGDRCKGPSFVMYSQSKSASRGIDSHPNQTYTGVS